MHFVHKRSSRADATPLLFIHGWPGSFFEVTKIIGPLTEPAQHGGRAEDSFHVVAVSLPGYGFSSKPRQPGYSNRRIAGMLAQLMARLGYNRYGAQGGDWGAIIVRQLGLVDPTHLIGLHSNMCVAGPPPGANPNEGVSPEELKQSEAARGADRERNRLQPASGNEAANARLLAERLARRPRRMDRREVPDLVRLGRQRREALHEGRAPHQHHDLLGHRNGAVVRPAVLREPERSGAAGPRRSAVRLRALSAGDVRCRAEAVD